MSVSARGEWAPSFRVLGVRVHAVQINDVVSQMRRWIEEASYGHYVAVTGMHGVVESRKNPDFRAILNACDLVVPDGMPLVWLGRQRGFALKRRVYGPELMATFCEETAEDYRHFLYGGAEGVPEQLALIMRERYKSRIVGTYSPPFRDLNPEEKEAIIERIRAAQPDLVWVGLSTPKQERWMAEYREKLGVPILIGVGAAYDFHTGRVKQAPAWAREHGLEWLFRLLSEPRRLWRRYLIGGSQFVWEVALEMLRIKSFN